MKNPRKIQKGSESMNEKDEKEMTELAEEIMTAAGVGRNV